MHPRLTDLPRPVGIRINPVMLPWSATIQPHLEPHRVPILWRSQYHVQVSTMKSERNLTWSFLKHSALRADIPRPAQSPLIQRQFCRKTVIPTRVLSHAIRRSEVLGASVGVHKTPNTPQPPQCACMVLHMNVLCVGGSSVAKNSTPNAKADTPESRKLRRKCLHCNLFERLPETECLHCCGSWKTKTEPWRTVLSTRRTDCSPPLF
jgi:hypothetical protein